MNTTLAVVVSAIVILITALVVITIFSGGAGQVGTITSASSVCQTQGRSACAATCNLPITWSIPSVNQGGSLVTCASLNDNCGKCDDGVVGSQKSCGFTTPNNCHTTVTPAAPAKTSGSSF